MIIAVVTGGAASVLMLRLLVNALVPPGPTAATAI